MSALVRSHLHPEALSACTNGRSRAYRIAVIDHYRNEVRAAIVERIVMFGADLEFRTLTQELAVELDEQASAAAGLLWPTTNAIYKAALEAAYV